MKFQLKKGLFLGVLVLLFMLIITVCNSSGTSSDSETANEPKNEETNNNEGAAQEEEELEPIKIGVLASLTGALESYGQQTTRGFELGLEYATNGTMEVAGRKIEYFFEDTETKPEVAVQKATKLLEENNVDFLVGSSSSGDTLAVLPLAEEYEKIMIVEPAVADSITGSEFNKYIFRTARNSSQDAVAGAAAIALGAEIVLEEYADPAATDFTSNIQKIIDASPDYLFVVWAGANSPWNQISDMQLQERGIKISTGAPDIPALSTMDALVGMEGFSVYYHELPDNEINDWLIEEHTKRYNGEVPDLFTPGGMTAAIAIVEALKKTNGETDADLLIETIEGMSFDTPKGMMTFRPEDHQALQSLYAVRLEEREGVSYPVPVLIRELTPEETAPPIRN